MPHRSGERRAGVLPDRLRPLFWDVEFNDLRWPRDRDNVTLRVLTAGDWDSVLWLRRILTDKGLKRWILARGGRGLDPKRLRFWQAVLGLPRRRVDVWVSAMREDPWHRRVVR